MSLINTLLFVSIDILEDVPKGADTYIMAMACEPTLRFPRIDEVEAETRDELRVVGVELEGLLGSHTESAQIFARRKGY